MLMLVAVWHAATNVWNMLPSTVNFNSLSTLRVL